MKRLAVFIFIVMPILLAGCNTYNPQVRALIRENRILENEMYRLRAQLQECQTCPSGAAVQSAHPTYVYTEGSGPMITGPEMTYQQDGSTVISDVPRRTGCAAGSSDGEPSRLPPDDSSNMQRDRSIDTSFDNSQYPTIEANDDSSLVDYLTLNERLTGGVDLDGRYGHDGLLVLVEPRDRQAKVLKAPAEVNVALIDPEQPEEFARVARWDFTKEQTAQLFRDVGSGQAIALKLPWPGRPPTNSKMLLMVRYVTDDGRRLQVNRDIKLVLPDGSSEPSSRGSGCQVPETVEEPPAPSRTTEPEPVVAPAEPTARPGLDSNLPDSPPREYDDGVAPRSGLTSPYGSTDIGVPPAGLSPSGTGTGGVEPIMPNLGPATDPNYGTPYGPSYDPNYGPAAPGPAVDPMIPGVVPEAIPPGTRSTPDAESTRRDPPGLSTTHREPIRSTQRQRPIWTPYRQLR